jgi:DNA-binding transcriptional ArsR family regulator
MDSLAGRLVSRLRGESDDAAVVGLDDEAADRVFDALGSETTRAVLAACYEEPHTPAELAEVTDTSLQNVSYHVAKLEDADLLEPVETRYASNGQEATAYGPTRQATVVVAGEESFVQRLRDAVERLFAPVVLLALASSVVGLRIHGVEPVVGPTASPIPSEEAQSADVPAFLFFLGGALALLVVDRLGLLRRRSARRDGRAAVLLGRETDRTRRQVFVAFGVLLAMPLALAEPVGGGIELFMHLEESLVLGLLTIPLCGGILATVGAAKNGGLVPCWLLGSAPVGGAGLFVSMGVDHPLVFVAIPIVLSGIYGLLAGTMGYLVGLRLNEDSGIRPSRWITVLLVCYVVVVVAFLTALQFRWIVL